MQNKYIDEPAAMLPADETDANAVDLQQQAADDELVDAADESEDDPQPSITSRYHKRIMGRVKSHHNSLTAELRSLRDRVNLGTAQPGDSERIKEVREMLREIHDVGTK